MTITDERVKRHVLPYENRSQRFLLAPSDLAGNWHRRQYFHLYEARVAQAKQRVVANAKLMLGEHIEVSSLEKVAENGDDIDARQVDVLVVGTIEKRIKARPSVLKAMADEEMKMEDLDDEEGGAAEIDEEMPSLIGNKDFLEFEDDSQIVRLTGKINMDNVATGCTCGLYGRQVSDGVFDVKQVVWPTPAPQKPFPKVKDDPKIAILSGIEICGDPVRDANTLSSLNLFSQWVGGQMGIEADDVSRIARVLIAGESINVSAQIQEFSSKAAYLVRHEEAPNVGCAKTLDEHIARLTALVPVDLMPGEGDPTMALHPQRPIHKTVLPMAGLNGGTLNLTTNPYEFTLGGIDFCALSGQTVSDLRRLSNIQSACQLMELMLTWQHVAPTCPDTVDGFPLHDRDPFSIERYPHVMIAGNQPKPEVTVHVGSGNRKCTLIAIPRFARSQLVAILNLRTFEVDWKQFSI